MILKEDNYKDKISALAAKDWQPLFDLIPVIRNTSHYRETICDEQDDKGVTYLPYSIEEPIVSRFRETAYSLSIIIDFNWGSWEEGRNMARDEQFDYDTIDIPTKCKIITAIVRNDRFCDGALCSAFESGLILRILQSIERQVRGINR